MSFILWCLFLPSDVISPFVSTMAKYLFVVNTGNQDWVRESWQGPCLTVIWMVSPALPSRSNGKDPILQLRKWSLHDDTLTPMVSHQENRTVWVHSWVIWLSQSSGCTSIKWEIAALRTGWEGKGLHRESGKASSGFPSHKVAYHLPVRDCGRELSDELCTYRQENKDTFV